MWVRFGLYNLLCARIPGSGCLSFLRFGKFPEIVSSANFSVLSLYVLLLSQIMQLMVYFDVVPWLPSTVFTFVIFVCFHSDLGGLNCPVFDFTHPYSLYCWTLCCAFQFSYYVLQLWDFYLYFLTDLCLLKFLFSIHVRTSAIIFMTIIWSLYHINHLPLFQCFLFDSLVLFVCFLIRDLEPCSSIWKLFLFSSFSYSLLCIRYNRQLFPVF